PPAMPHPAIAPNLHQSPDVPVNLPAKVALHHIVPVDDLSQASEFLFGEVLHLGVRIDVCLGTDRDRVVRSDAEDITERYIDLLIIGDVYPCDTGHALPPLALPLFVLGIGAK